MNKHVNSEVVISKVDVCYFYWKSFVNFSLLKRAEQIFIVNFTSDIVVCSSIKWKTEHFSNTLICPACDYALKEKWAVLRINLNLSDHFKAMVLAGQKPEIIIEICSNALTFWNYQIYQESLYQEWVNKKLREQSLVAEQQYQELIGKLQAEIRTMKIKLEEAEKDAQTVLDRYEELASKYNDKVRDNFKLVNNYESLRRRSVDGTFQQLPAKLMQKPQNEQSRILEKDGPFFGRFLDKSSHHATSTSDNTYEHFFDQLLNESAEPEDDGSPVEKHHNNNHHNHQFVINLNRSGSPLMKPIRKNNTSEFLFIFVVFK
ncbi:E3 ubiquitin-protein ligase CCNB1IP1 [Trichinella zimbabwensis]|uniref:E3 ubiquitin-protein ligase CCNB1IP1 n=1 Tax=Trichinella zimbabwensis TaxID=268475 RepID=A0A0V1HY82_9BILA|nr:E3 ubiquitin-protein ligase CCNB1IP1 [Trichinella zimbabwensis]